MCVLITICAVGVKYINYTKNLIYSVNKFDPKISFLVLTDTPSSFLMFPDIKIINYTKDKFSYHDKLIVLEEGLKMKDTVLLIDADNKLNETHNLELLFDIEDIEPGIYPHFLWKYPHECSIDNFFLGNTPRVPYGGLYKEFCKNNNIITENSCLMQESFILIKQDETNKINIDCFFETWKKLAVFCNEQDKYRNQHILGYGEGYSIAVSASNSNLKVITDNYKVNKIKDCFKHFAWN